MTVKDTPQTLRCICEPWSKHCSAYCWRPSPCPVLPAMTTWPRQQQQLHTQCHLPLFILS